MVAGHPLYSLGKKSLHLVPSALIQTLITSKRKIVEDFRRWRWIRHEKIFQKRLKNFYFNSICQPTAS
jgi:hypothetical protein